jgi:hypothetical protein
MDLNDCLWRVEFDSFENENTQAPKRSLYEGLALTISCVDEMMTSADGSSDILILIQELNESGIFHPIGGELWAASLILCSLILRNARYLSESSVLELGSGVGIPSMLLIFLKLKYLREKVQCGPLYVTDYDEEVLNNLHSVIRKQFEGNLFHQESEDESKRIEAEGSKLMLSSSVREQVGKLSVFIQRLDWNNFLLEEEDEEDEEENEDDRRSLPCCKVMIGSELIYTSTQRGLSSLIL